MLVKGLRTSRKSRMLRKRNYRKSETFELRKQSIKDAKSIVSLNKARVEDSKLSPPTAYKVSQVHPYPLLYMSN